MKNEIGGKSAHHVLGAMAEVDDIKHAEYNGQPQTQQRVKRAVDQADQQLSKQRRRGDAEDLEHGKGSVRKNGAGRKPAPLFSTDQPLTNGQLPSLSGRNASSAGMVARTL